MANLILTLLPAVVTFTIATWSSSTNKIQPRSALPGRTADAPCRC